MLNSGDLWNFASIYVFESRFICLQNVMDVILVGLTSVVYKDLLPFQVGMELRKSYKSVDNREKVMTVPVLHQKSFFIKNMYWYKCCYKFSCESIIH